MTQFATVALFRRDGVLTYRPPLKLVLDNLTQARKSAARHWMGTIRNPDKVSRIIVLSGDSRTLSLSERAATGQWIETQIPTGVALQQAHLAACLPLLMIEKPQAALPDVLEINGAIYRREI